MSGQSDHPSTGKPGLLKRLSSFGERPRRRRGDAGKVVYYSSDLFNAAMMVDATRDGIDEPSGEPKPKAKR